jgi:hypothetical protein
MNALSEGFGSEAWKEELLTLDPAWNMTTSVPHGRLPLDDFRNCSHCLAACERR